MSDPSVLMGIRAAAAGDFQQARDCLSAAVQAEPANEEAWLLLGHCFQDDPAQRRACYQRVLELNPSNDLARISLSRTEPVQPALSEAISAPTAKPPIIQATRKENPALRRVLLAGLLLVVVTIAYFAWHQASQPVFSGPTPQSGMFLADGTLITAVPSPGDGSVPTALPHSITLIDGTVITSESGFIIGPNGAVITPGPAQPVDENIAQAIKLMNNQDYPGAIKSWDQVIALAPQNDNAFYERAVCYYILAKSQNAQDVYLSDLRSAASDLQQAIRLLPDKLDYILLRRQVLTDFAYSQDLRVDRDLLFRLAATEGYKALTLKQPLAQILFLKRQTAENLIEAGRCQDGLDLLKEVADQTPTNEDFYGGVLMIESKGQACLGHLDLALQNIDASTFNGSSLDTKAYLKALYLYQAGRSAEARQVIDQTIQQTPAYSGWRYYLRAVLQAEAGDPQAASQDLDTGAMYTWDRNGLYSYARAKLALASGDQPGGIQWLQHAEASLMTNAVPLRERILNELAALGALPLQPTPSVDFPGLNDLTPIP